MGLCKQLKKLIAHFDFFSQPITLRYKQEPDYKTCTGGCCSLILVIIFVSIFFGTALKTVNREYINAVINQYEEEDPTYFGTSIQSKFMFAVGIDDIDLNQGLKYFQVTMQKRNISAGHNLTQYISLQKCTRDQWSKIGQKFGPIYDRLHFNKFLCPPQDIQIELQGRFTSEIFQYYKISVSKCQPSIQSRGCISSQAIESYLHAKQVFKFNFYFVNALLNPATHQLISYYLEDVNYFTFSPTLGVSATILLQEFRIQTDQTIFPFEDISEVSGGSVRNKADSFNYNVKKDEYVRFYLRKSNILLKIDRSFRKADDTLSYIGGLFSAILTVLLFMEKFNQTSFELELAKNLYHQKEETANLSSFNIFSYAGFFVYQLLTNIGIPVSWQKMRIWNESVQQIKNQLDIRLIMKKINLFERIIHTMLQKSQFECFEYCKPTTLKQASAFRQKYKARKRIRKLAQKRKEMQENFKELAQMKPRKKNSKNNKVMPMQQTTEVFGTDIDLEDKIQKQEQTNQKSQKQQEIGQEQFYKNMDDLYQNVENGLSVSAKILTALDPKIKQFYENKRKQCFRIKATNQSLEYVFKRASEQQEQ